MVQVIKFIPKPKKAPGPQLAKLVFMENLIAQVHDNPKAALPQSIDKQGLTWLLEDLEAARGEDQDAIDYFKRIVSGMPGGGALIDGDYFWGRYSFWVGMFYLKAVGLIDFEEAPAFKQLVSIRKLTKRVVKNINFVGDYDTIRSTWHAHERIIFNAAPFAWWLVKWPLKDKLIELYNESNPGPKRFGLSRGKPKLRRPRQLV